MVWAEGLSFALRLGISAPAPGGFTEGLASTSATKGPVAGEGAWTNEGVLRVRLGSRWFKLLGRTRRSLRRRSLKDRIDLVGVLGRFVLGGEQLFELIPQVLRLHKVTLLVKRTNR